jgi:hypothetical protein
MPSEIPEDNVPLEYLMDEEALRRRYQEVIADGASPALARSYITEVALSMTMNEAMSISLRSNALRRALDNAVFSDGG